MNALEQGPFTGYILDTETGNVLPVNGRGVIQEIEIHNKEYIKKHKKEPRHIVISREEALERLGLMSKAGVVQAVPRPEKKVIEKPIKKAVKKTTRKKQSYDIK